VKTIDSMRAAAALCVVLVAGLLQNASAHPAAPQCTLTATGQNNPAVDVAAVTQAVNSPTLSGDATVCLSGIFDFGPPPTSPPLMSVAINPNPSVTSLRIVGLGDGAGNKATIRRGIQALSLAQTATLPSLVIENLKFEGPAFTAISIFRGNESVRISNVHVAGVQSYFFAPFNGAFREGIVVTSALGPIDGEVVISDNVIDGGTYGAPDTTLVVSSGILVQGATAQGAPQNFNARVNVSRNRVLNWSGTGILAIALTEAAIEGNKIDPGAFANLTAGCTPNGERAANGITLANTVDSTVKDNVITLVPALTGAGAAPNCTAALILNGVSGGSDDGNIVFGNRIRGTGNYAIVAGTPSGSVETNNLFAFNKTGNFAPLSATLFIGPGATANAFIGSFASIEGNVAGNWVLNP